MPILEGGGVIVPTLYIPLVPSRMSYLPIESILDSKLFEDMACVQH